MAYSNLQLKCDLHVGQTCSVKQNIPIRAKAEIDQLSGHHRNMTTYIQTLTITDEIRLDSATKTQSETRIIVGFMVDTGYMTRGKYNLNDSDSVRRRNKTSKQFLKLGFPNINTESGAVLVNIKPGATSGTYTSPPKNELAFSITVSKN